IPKLGINPSSVDLVPVGQNQEVRMTPGQTLYVVNNLYPYELQVGSKLSSDPVDSWDSHSQDSRDEPGKRRRKEEEVTEGIPQARNAEAGGGLRRKEPAGGWNAGLKSSMRDPKLQVYKDEKAVVIQDKYPKARYHWLVLPWDSIRDLQSLTKEHAELLEHMHAVGIQMTQRCPAGNTLEFQLGYHAIPSMSQLHLHVISQDFDSPCLKTAKHWNSFTTSYFLHSQDVIKMIRSDGRVKVEPGISRLLRSPLTCHRCSEKFPSVPRLKEHLRRHRTT
ncbi:APTX protein, partial [Rhynochetos jubatus]|nr:APTX protein [Rhynochetos jubatus]